jgi:hypothetical protein
LAEQAFGGVIAADQAAGAAEPLDEVAEQRIDRLVGHDAQARHGLGHLLHLLQLELGEQLAGILFATGQ